MDDLSGIKAMIFDLDGLLIDSEPYWLRADASLFKKFNKIHTADVNRGIMGMGQKEIAAYFIKTYGFEMGVDDLIAQRMSLLYEYLMPNLSLLAGARDIVEIFYKRGLALAVATSGHSIVRTREILVKTGLDKFFPVIVSGDDLERSKPAPDIFLKAAEMLGVDGVVCLVLEDAPNGAAAGRAAGMRVFGVNRDAEIRERLKDAGADRVFESLGEIVMSLQ